MWTVDVENHFITIQRMDCYEGDLPSACYQERLLDLTETNSHSEKVSRPKDSVRYSRLSMNIISPHSLCIDRLHHGLENILSVLPSSSVHSLDRLGQQQHNASL